MIFVFKQTFVNVLEVQATEKKTKRDSLSKVSSVSFLQILSGKNLFWIYSLQLLLRPVSTDMYVLVKISWCIFSDIELVS